jgi:DNA-directed RNA polymerase specialized sigma subunit
MTLAATTESRLACASIGNPAAFTELVTGMEGLVQGLAKRHVNCAGAELRAELESAGRQALCESVVTFTKSGANCRFSTFAGQRMNRAMVSFLRTADGTGTEWRARAQKQARRARQQLIDALGDEPTSEEMAFYSGVSSSQTVDTQLSRVSLADVAHELTYPVAVGDDDAEVEYEQRRGKLSMAESALLDEVVEMGSYSDEHGYMHYRADGVSLSEVAVRMDVDRDSIESRLGSILATLVECAEHNDS